MRIGVLCLLSCGWACFASDDKCKGACACNFNISMSSHAYESMTFDGISATTKEECTMLAFLYEKDVVHIPAWSNRHDIRKAWYSNIIHPEKSCNVTSFEKANKKLRRITTVTDIYASTHVPADVLSWDEAMHAMPRWADPTSSYVFHRDDPDILPENRGRVLIQRVTEMGPAYMHAPVMLQYYLISKYSRSKIDPVILDIAKYIRDAFTTKQLKRHLLYDEGMPSNMLMSMLLHKYTETKIVPFDKIDTEFLKKHGPAMLSGFPLCDGFGSDDGRLVYDLGDCDASVEHVLHPNSAPAAPLQCNNRDGSRSAGRCVTNHAMLIIGVRGEGAARRFLVQNWWRRHQFVEMSLDYLESLTRRSLDISAYVACTPQLAVPAGFAQAAAPYADSGHIDAREPEGLSGGEGNIWL